MLTFLYLASKEGFQVDSYEDEAIGTLTINDRGIPWVSTVTLQPKIRFSGSKQPDPAQEARLHHEAHEQCFIAQSIKTNVTVRAS
jgi:organic hydroperoxide reductase OsmC/OhrA